MNVLQNDVITRYGKQTQRPSSAWNKYDNVSSTDILRHLQSFYINPSTSDEERSKCLQVVRSLCHKTRFKSSCSDSHQQQQLISTQPLNLDLPQCIGTSRRRAGGRPHTSMATVGYPANHLPMRRRNLYETSYNRDFNTINPEMTDSVRPSTTIDAIYRTPSRRPVMQTTYCDEYQTKSDWQESKTQPIFPLNGEKRNNPHPLQTFIVWRQPRPGETNEKDTSQKLNEQLQKLMDRANLNSTYQSDYIETIPNEKSRCSKSRDVKKSVPINSDSTMRVDFRRPPSTVVPQLLVPTTRYGSNVNKAVPAVGAVPNVVDGTHMNSQKHTTYDREFNGVPY